MVKKLALLVGCNYSNNSTVKNKLYGCINDVNFMHDLIREPCFGFLDNNIRILTDEAKTTHRESPTYSNILGALKKMIDDAEKGDTLLLYFSGGGALVDPPVKNHEFKKGIPAIIPCDLFPITATHILHEIKPLSDKAIFTFICDSSYSGGLFEENVETEFNVPDPRPKLRWKTIPSDIVPSLDVSGKSAADVSLNNKILFSSSKANEESVEVSPNHNDSKAIGAFSNAIQTILNSPQAVNPPVPRNDLNWPYTIWEVDAFTSALLGHLRFDQHPYVNYSDNGAARPFLGNEA